MPLPSVLGRVKVRRGYRLRTSSFCPSSRRGVLERRDLTDYHGKRAVALVSGGLDSVVSLAMAADVMDVRLVLFCNYGQRAVERERNAVLGVVGFYEFPFKEINAPWLGELAPEGMRRSAARAGAETAPEPSLDTLDAVWVPNRNGVLLNMAAAFAESFGCDFVVAGFNREEAVEFPDNRAEYVDRVNNGLEMSTRGGVKIVSFTQGLDKREIIIRGHELGAPLSVIWSCYHSRERMCGRCASCRRLKGAIAAVDEQQRPNLRFES
jgi:7-cyano-7-deazaguanine synthase